MRWARHHHLCISVALLPAASSSIRGLLACSNSCKTGCYLENKFCCPENCATTCKENNGYCLPTGLQADQPAVNCQPGNFSARCDLTCPSKCAEKVCTDGGRCIGYHLLGNEDAASLCQRGFYGSSCQWPCPSTCKELDCTYGGYCIGYHIMERTDVASICQPGYFGSRCQSSCPLNCRHVGHCAFNGFCIGFHEMNDGDPANLICRDGYFGPKCEGNCPKECQIACSFVGECLAPSLSPTSHPGGGKATLAPSTSYPTPTLYPTAPLLPTMAPRYATEEPTMSPTITVISVAPSSVPSQVPSGGNSNDQNTVPSVGPSVGENDGEIGLAERNEFEGENGGGEAAKENTATVGFILIGVLGTAGSCALALFLFHRRRSASENDAVALPSRAHRCYRSREVVKARNDDLGVFYTNPLPRPIPKPPEHAEL